MGVMAIDSEVRVKVLVLTHAWVDVSAADPWNVPAETAVHRLMWDSVSVVVTFVHGPAVPVIAFDPPEAAAIVGFFLVVSRAAAAVVPAAPGSAVWSLTKQDAVANVPSSQPFATAAV